MFPTRTKQRNTGRAESSHQMQSFTFTKEIMQSVENTPKMLQFISAVTVSLTVNVFRVYFKVKVRLLCKV